MFFHRCFIFCDVDYTIQTLYVLPEYILMAKCLNENNFLMKSFLFSLIRTGCFFLFFSVCISQVYAREPQLPHRANDGSVGDLVWLDRNVNGLQDAGETGFPGMEVVLLDDSGRVVAATFTEANGKYAFTGLETGTSGKGYEILFKLPDNFRFCRKNGSVSDGQNSDANEITGRSGVFLLMPGEINNAVDAGLISTALGTLPLHTLDLTGDLTAGKVKLKWLAENEMNTVRFVVQQSNDGVHFSTISITAVNGTINIPTYYYYTADISGVSASALYYRIRAEDEAGRSAYSNVTVIRLDKPVDIRVWPSPFVNEAHISYFSTASSSLTVGIYDIAGKEKWTGVYQLTRGINQLTVASLPDLSAGIYFLQISDSMNGRTLTRKIIKQ